MVAVEVAVSITQMTGRILSPNIWTLVLCHLLDLDEALLPPNTAAIHRQELLDTTMDKCRFNLLATMVARYRQLEVLPKAHHSRHRELTIVDYRLGNLMAILTGVMAISIKTPTMGFIGGDEGVNQSYDSRMGSA